MYTAPLVYIIKSKHYIGNTCYPGHIITESLKLKRPEMESRSCNSELVHVCWQHRDGWTLNHDHTLVPFENRPGSLICRGEDQVRSWSAHYYDEWRWLTARDTYSNIYIYIYIFFFFFQNYGWPLNNLGTRGANPLCSQKFCKKIWAGPVTPDVLGPW